MDDHRFIDLTGKRFGRWLVLEEVERPEKIRDKYSHYWLCLCDCGVKKNVAGNSLRSGNSNSCGCLKKEVASRRRRESLVGQRFGRLLVTGYDTTYKKPYCICQCDCGVIKSISERSLLKGQVLSCSCLHNEITADIGRNNIKDISGMKYGMLTVISFAYTKNPGGAFWNCRCDCGNEKIISANRLTGKRTVSCGCYRKNATGFAHLKEPGYVATYSVFYNYKREAKNRGLSFELDFYQFREITQKNCHYCGCPPSNTQKSINNNGDYVYNGIDRIDNNRGYDLDNIVPSCMKCNNAKKKMSYDDFKNYITKVYLYFIKGEANEY